MSARDTCGVMCSCNEHFLILSCGIAVQRLVMVLEVILVQTLIVEGPPSEVVPVVLSVLVN